MEYRVVPVVVALLCVVGIGLGGATLSNSLDQGGGGGSSPADNVSTQEPGSGEIAGGDSPGNGSAGQALQDTGNCFAGYSDLTLFWIVAAFSVGLSTIVAIRSGEVWTGIVTLPIVLISGTLLLAMTMLVVGCSLPGNETTPEASQPDISAGNGTDAADGSKGEGDDTTSRLQIGAIFLALVAALFALAVYVQRRDRPLTEDSEMDEMADSAEIATAASEAVDQLEQVSDSENAVYRAWARMAEPLDVDHPESSTPGEFADAARAAGLYPDDVDELTTLFEEVRYGTTQITAEHERRAEHALQRIERSANAASVAGQRLSDGEPTNHESRGEQT